MDHNPIPFFVVMSAINPAINLLFLIIAGDNDLIVVGIDNAVQERLVFLLSWDGDGAPIRSSSSASSILVMLLVVQDIQRRNIGLTTATKFFAAFGTRSLTLVGQAQLFVPLLDRFGLVQGTFLRSTAQIIIRARRQRRWPDIITSSSIRMIGSVVVVGSGIRSRIQEAAVIAAQAPPSRSTGATHEEKGRRLVLVDV